MLENPSRATFACLSVLRFLAEEALIKANQLGHCRFCKEFDKATRLPDAFASVGNAVGEMASAFPRLIMHMPARKNVVAHAGQSERLERAGRKSPKPVPCLGLESRA